MVNQRSHAERWVETSSPENLKKSLYENQYWMFVIFRLIFRIASQLSSSAHRRFAAGPVFGNMNQFTGLGVFLDTYPNADKSYDVSDTCCTRQLCTSVLQDIMFLFFPASLWNVRGHNVELRQHQNLLRAFHFHRAAVTTSSHVVHLSLPNTCCCVLECSLWFSRGRCFVFNFLVFLAEGLPLCVCDAGERDVVV